MQSNVIRIGTLTGIILLVRPNGYCTDNEGNHYGNLLHDRVEHLVDLFHDRWPIPYAQWIHQGMSQNLICRLQQARQRLHSA